MKIELKFAELQTPLFLSGTNHGLKIDNVKRSVRLVYDRAEKELHVLHAGEVAIIPTTNVVSMTPVNSNELGYTAVEKKAAPQAPSTNKTNGKVKAQVSDPVRDAVYGKGN